MGLRAVGVQACLGPTVQLRAPHTQREGGAAASKTAGTGRQWEHVQSLQAVI